MKSFKIQFEPHYLCEIFPEPPYLVQGELVNPYLIF